MILNLLLSLNLLVCVALIGVVLLQRSEGGALGTGGGPAGLITTRGAGDLLTRTTWVLFSAFLLLSLGLTLYSGRMHSSQAIIDRLKLQSINPDAAPITAPTPTLPSPSGAAPGQLAPAPLPSPTLATPATTPPPALTAPIPTVHAPTRTAARAASTQAATPAAAPAAAPAEAAPPVITAPPPPPRVEAAPLDVPKPPAPKPADPDAPVKTNTPP